MNIGDRVFVRIYDQQEFIGIIVGESCDGKAWSIQKDGRKYPRSIHKYFCHYVDAREDAR